MKKKPTNITIFTDMSHKDGITGWAYYIRSDYYKLTGSGAFESANNSYRNELYAIGKAIRKIQSYHDPRVEIKNIYVYCDNKGVVDTLEHYQKHGEVKEIKDKEYQKRLKVFLDSLNYTFVPRKVVAHTSGKCIRTKVNNWMDEMARKARLSYAEIKFGALKKY